SENAQKVEPGNRSNTGCLRRKLESHERRVMTQEQLEDTVFGAVHDRKLEAVFQPACLARETGFLQESSAQLIDLRKQLRGHKSLELFEAGLAHVGNGEAAELEEATAT